MISIGLDPGVSPGIAVWQSCELDYPICLYSSPRWRKPLSPRQESEVLQEALAAAKIATWPERDDVVCVIESQFAGPNPKTLIKLARSAGRWEAHAGLAGLRVIWCEPSEWRAELELEAKSSADIRDDLAAWCVDYGVTVSGPDAASACALAVWGLAHPHGLDAEKAAAIIEKARRKVERAGIAAARAARKAAKGAK